MAVGTSKCEQIVRTLEGILQDYSLNEIDKEAIQKSIRIIKNAVQLLLEIDVMYGYKAKDLPAFDDENDVVEWLERRCIT